MDNARKNGRKMSRIIQLRNGIIGIILAILIIAVINTPLNNLANQMLGGQATELKILIYSSITAIMIIISLLFPINTLTPDSER